MGERKKRLRLREFNIYLFGSDSEKESVSEFTFKSLCKITP